MCFQVINVIAKDLQTVICASWFDMINCCIQRVTTETVFLRCSILFRIK